MCTFTLLFDRSSYIHLLSFCQSCTLSVSSPLVFMVSKISSSLRHLGCLLLCFLVGSNYQTCLVLYLLICMSISKSFHKFPFLLFCFFICHLCALLFSHCIFCPFFIILPFLNNPIIHLHWE